MPSNYSQSTVEFTNVPYGRKKLSNSELGFSLKINWDLGLDTPHQDPQTNQFDPLSMGCN